MFYNFIKMKNEEANRMTCTDCNDAKNIQHCKGAQEKWYKCFHNYKLTQAKEELKKAHQHAPRGDRERFWRAGIIISKKALAI